MLEDHEEPVREAPVVAGLGLMALGLILSRLESRTLAMPAPRRRRRDARARFRRGDRIGAVAQASRDRLVDFMPNNIAAGIGRSMLIAGCGLLVVRALDRLAGED